MTHVLRIVQPRRTSPASVPPAPGSPCPPTGRRSGSAPRPTRPTSSSTARSRSAAAARRSPASAPVTSSARWRSSTARCAAPRSSPSPASSSSTSPTRPCASSWPRSRPSRMRSTPWRKAANPLPSRLRDCVIPAAIRPLLRSAHAQFVTQQQGLLPPARGRCADPADARSRPGRAGRSTSSTRATRRWPRRSRTWSARVDVLLGNLEDAVKADNKVAAREGLVKIAQDDRRARRTTAPPSCGRGSTPSTAPGCSTT